MPREDVSENLGVDMQLHRQLRRTRKDRTSASFERLSLDGSARTPMPVQRVCPGAELIAIRREESFALEPVEESAPSDAD